MVGTGLAFVCLAAALGVLVALSLIDLRHRILPNTLVFTFAVLGLAFHLATDFRFLPPLSLVWGGLTGFGVLYGIRFMANYVYKQDALGLGDVKLMGAAGLWLGPAQVMFALAAGALASVAHGLLYALWQSARTKTPFNLRRLQIPAGPGFAVGIVVAGYLLFSETIGGTAG